MIAWTSGSARLTTTDGFRMREMIQGDQLDMGPIVLTQEKYARLMSTDTVPPSLTAQRRRDQGTGRDTRESEGQSSIKF